MSAGRRGGKSKTRPSKGRPPRSAKRRTVPVALLILAALIVLAGLGAAVLYKAPGPAPREGGESTTVFLKRGSHLPGIARDLAEAGVIRSGPLFIALTELTGRGRRLQAGEYAIPAGASMADILGMIRAGKVVRHLVTIPEGLTSQMAVDILTKTPVLAGEVDAPTEGSIMPQTYDVERGEDRTAVLARMTAAQSALLARLWAGRDPGLPYTTPEQAVTLASIIEKETALPAERPHVASVFLNRLARGMRLESDPTIIYGLTRGRPLGRSLTHEEVVRPTRYNTYVISGLPPTPIANPGQASLEAALHPARSDDLFFVADGSGGHVFAATFSQHQRNVARWRAIALDAQRRAER